MRKDQYLEWWEKLIELEPTPAEFSYEFSRSGIKDVDKHELFRVAGKIGGEGYYELFFGLIICLVKAFSHVKSVGPAAAVKLCPITVAVGFDRV